MEFNFSFKWACGHASHPSLPNKIYIQSDNGYQSGPGASTNQSSALYQSASCYMSVNSNFFLSFYLCLQSRNQWPSCTLRWIILLKVSCSVRIQKSCSVIVTAKHVDNGVFPKWNKNSGNSGNLINHWSITWAQFKDPVSNMSLAGAVVAPQSLTQELSMWQVWALLL